MKYLQKLTLTFVLLLSISAFAVSPLQAAAHEGLVGSEARDFSQTELKIVFPEVEGWEKSDIVRYPVPELGYSINYESETAGRVTIYIYNGGRKTIANGITDSVVKAEIEKTKTEIYMVEKMGRYKNVKEIINDTLVLGGENGKIDALHCTLRFSAGSDDLTSEIYLFGFQNHFVKFRATRLYVKDEVKNAELARLLTSMDSLFSGDGTSALRGN
jgi:hypothetical protein